MSRSALVLYSYEPEHEDELALKTGEIITNIVEVDVGWWEGDLNGKRGLLPNNFVKELAAGLPAPAAASRAEVVTTAADKKVKVTFDYEAEDEDELTLHVGEVIDFLCEAEEGWWWGKLNGKTGVFPSNFVEVLDEKEYVTQTKDKPMEIPTYREIGPEGDFQSRMREMEQQLTNVQRQLRERKLQLAILRAKLRQKVQQLENSERENEQQDARFHEQLRRKDEQKENLRRQMREQSDDLQRRLGEMEQQLREKDELEECFQRQITELEEQCREKEDESGNLQQQLTTLQGQLRAKDLEIKELETTLSTAQQALSEQQRQQSPDWVIPRDQIQLMTDKVLGRGGWGSVVEGKYCGCAVAVKQIHELILSDHNRNLFEREMNIASRCRHPCLLQFIGATNDEGSPLFVTELMESSLRALLEQRSLSAAEVSIISLDVARALSYLHHKTPPIIHRDISSANVLLWRQGDQWRGKVSDYGTANFMQHTMTVAPGNATYSAPEALTSNQTVKVDVYSFGVLLCEMCIRELPDPQKRDQQIAMVTNRLLRALIRACVQTEPEARPNMEEIIEELEEPV